MYLNVFNRQVSHFAEIHTVDTIPTTGVSTSMLDNLSVPYSTFIAPCKITGDSSAVMANFGFRMTSFGKPIVFISSFC